MFRFKTLTSAAALMAVASGASALTVTVDTANGGILATAVYSSIGSDGPNGFNSGGGGSFAPGVLNFINMYVDPDITGPGDVDVTKIDSTSGQANDTFSIGSLSATIFNNESTSFEWSSDTAVEFVIYKGGNDPKFQVHYYAGGIFGNRLTSDQGLSNLTSIDTGGTPVVPLPAAGWLLLAGVGGLTAAKRRRKI